MIGTDETSNPTLSDVRCLVVEDDNFMRNTIARMLRWLECRQIETSENGQKALELLHESANSFDVIISDYQMPEMNGLELLKSIRSGYQSVPRDVNFAILTNHAERHVVGAAFLLDVDCFMQKPVSTTTLRDRIARMIRTDRPLKRPAEYDNVMTRADVETKQPVDPGVNATTLRKKSNTDNKTGRVTVAAINEIQAGSKLSQDVYTPNGQLIVANGQTLTERLLGKLSDLESVGMSIGSLKIIASH